MGNSTQCLPVTPPRNFITDFVDSRGFNDYFNNNTTWGLMPDPVRDYAKDVLIDSPASTTLFLTNPVELIKYEFSDTYCAYNMLGAYLVPKGYIAKTPRIDKFGTAPVNIPLTPKSEPPTSFPDSADQPQ